MGHRFSSASKDEAFYPSLAYDREAVAGPGQTHHLTQVEVEAGNK